MVYGRILYNSIKEYTPKWYPTIPYSQTTKPVFGNSGPTQEGSPNSSQLGTAKSSPKEGGAFSANSSSPAGSTKFLCSASASECGQLYTSLCYHFTNRITNTALMKLRWPKRRLSRRRKKRRSWLSRQRVEPVNDAQAKIILFY